MNINQFKQFTLEHHGLLLDFRSHVYLENQYGLNPQYNYDLAETVVTSLFAFWDKHNVNYAMRYNKDQMLDELRSSPLNQRLRFWLESDEDIITVISHMSINIDFDDTVEVTAINGVGETETFHVQTTDGLFRSDLGCWILAPGNDGDIDQDDYPFFDFDLIVSEAEKYVRDTYEIKETANSELYFKVYNNKVEIVELNRHFINSDSSSYQTEYKLVETFEDEDDADKYITERTKSTK